MFLANVTRYVDAFLVGLYPSLESLGEVVFGDGSQYNTEEMEYIQCR